MAKFKPGDKVIISKDSKNIWIRGKKAISELNDFIKDHDLTWGMNV